VGFGLGAKPEYLRRDAMLHVHSDYIVSFEKSFDRSQFVTNAL
jgi:hypothetical protein